MKKIFEKEITIIDGNSKETGIATIEQDVDDNNKFYLVEFKGKNVDEGTYYYNWILKEAGLFKI